MKQTDKWMNRQLQEQCFMPDMASVMNGNRPVYASFNDNLDSFTGQ